MPPPRLLFAGLVDDAALFPPGNAPMPLALDEHVLHRKAWYADLVGPFVCPASRVDELAATLPAAETLEVSLVLDVTGDAAQQALSAATADPRLRLVAVEAAHARLGDDAAAVGASLRRLSGTVGYLEVARDEVGIGLALVREGGWRAAKLRTGGATPEAFPPAGEVAAFVNSCLERGVPFKLTAGLHHAVRAHDPTVGADQHGVLNVLAAVHAATTGADLLGWLEERDSERLAATVGGWGLEEATAVRAWFRSFGCCGVTDPLTELAELGLLEESP